ncbi:hypothetical protein C3432_19515 [Citrobacter amalonaticus]|uniref:Fimbrial protein n=1 Tax=Citrobacter amalonaticus TaxID=35703 RepID=A0A2S4RXM7_CITAM|nr:hypothetical protein [Citrobacter amalonaticus]POT56166.1 hypothetical protein C3432_19515 [Citrobacter amalonaticus]POT74475.1 hypothetical protein C3436_17155 [Citrobacter amalonaticus]POU65274.1 hypothetical protein C3430_13895 [Citrobacter amalonaticus]POV04109.1 hypothetical protein C3424_18835 [Citrobacter amalonaticus]
MKLNSLLCGLALAGMYVAAPSFAATYVAGSENYANVQVTMGGAITCSIATNPVKGNGATDTSLAVKIESKCELGATSFPTAVGIGATKPGYTFTSTADGVTVNNGTDSVDFIWDTGMDKHALGSATDDDIFGGTYAVTDPLVSKEVTATIQKPGGGNLPVGDWDIPLVMAMYTN